MCYNQKKNKMKFFFILFSFICYFNCCSQTFDLYSDVWAFSKTTKRITPINGRNFSYPSSEMLSKIDTLKISSYLLISFNNFRSDYGKPSVTESKEMTKQSKSYAKKLSESFCHDVNLSENEDEVIATINFILISKIDYNSTDVNKVIADCIFDIFISSDSHMNMLLNSEHTTYGFGVYQNKSSFSICIRSTK